MEKFARRCDITGCGMNEGYVFNDGEKYACDESSALQIAQQYGYDNLDDAYNGHAYYYTEWDEVDDDEWYDADGNVHILDNEFNN
jgi:hypothetical protein